MNTHFTTSSCASICPSSYVPVFRRRSLKAVLAYLRGLPDEYPIGAAVVQWCSREAVALSPDTRAAQARRAVQHVLLEV